MAGERGGGEHSESIDAKLDELTPEQRRVYRRNRKRLAVEAALMERWAKHGFLSGTEEERNE